MKQTDYITPLNRPIFTHTLLNHLQYYVWLDMRWLIVCLFICLQQTFMCYILKLPPRSNNLTYEENVKSCHNLKVILSLWNLFLSVMIALRNNMLSFLFLFRKNLILNFITRLSIEIIFEINKRWNLTMAAISLSPEVLSRCSKFPDSCLQLCYMKEFVHLPNWNLNIRMGIVS